MLLLEMVQIVRPPPSSMRYGVDHADQEYICPERSSSNQERIDDLSEVSSIIKSIPVAVPDTY